MPALYVYYGDLIIFERVTTDKESLTADTESSLQNALLHVLSAVQTIDHIPNAMYDFEVR